MARTAAHNKSVTIYASQSWLHNSRDIQKWPHSGFDQMSLVLYWSTRYTQLMCIAIWLPSPGSPYNVGPMGWVVDPMDDGGGWPAPGPGHIGPTRGQDISTRALLCRLGRPLGCSGGVCGTADRQPYGQTDGQKTDTYRQTYAYRHADRQHDGQTAIYIIHHKCSKHIHSYHVRPAMVMDIV